MGIYPHGYPWIKVSWKIDKQYIHKIIHAKAELDLTFAVITKADSRTFVYEKAHIERPLEFYVVSSLEMQQLKEYRTWKDEREHWLRGLILAFVGAMFVHLFSFIGLAIMPAESMKTKAADYFVYGLCSYFVIDAIGFLLLIFIRLIFIGP